MDNLGRNVKMLFLEKQRRGSDRKDRNRRRLRYRVKEGDRNGGGNPQRRDSFREDQKSGLVSQSQHAVRVRAQKEG